MMWNRLSVLALLLAISSPAGFMSCSSTEVHTEKAPNADMGQYHTFAWSPPAQQEQSRDFSSRSDTILDQKVRNAVDQDLSKKGYVQDPAQADVHVAYSLRTRDRLQVEPSSYGPYGGPILSGNGVGYDYTYLQKEGSLVLDFIDPKTGKLLWRGIAITDIKDTGVTQKEVQHFVDKIMEKFPSRSESIG